MAKKVQCPYCARVFDGFGLLEIKTEGGWIVRLNKEKSGCEENKIYYSIAIIDTDAEIDDPNRELETGMNENDIDTLIAYLHKLKQTEI